MKPMREILRSHCVFDAAGRHTNGTDRESNHHYGDAYDRLFPDRSAVKLVLEVGTADGAGMLENMKNTAYLAQRAREKGIPFMVEAVAWGEQIPPGKEAAPEYIGQACRMALECGADVIKTTYTGDPKSFKEVLANVPIPVIILGGAAGELATVFQGVRDAMDAGAAGVAFGRNVFQSENPTVMVNALKELVHNGATVKEAIAKMK